jgi:catechol 2,3-dioxygenase-like lactoylglutathione lyase family enzyme
MGELGHHEDRLLRWIWRVGDQALIATQQQDQVALAELERPTGSGQPAPTLRDEMQARPAWVRARGDTDAPRRAQRAAHVAAVQRPQPAEHTTELILDRRARSRLGIRDRHEHGLPHHQPPRGSVDARSTILDRRSSTRSRLAAIMPSSAAPNEQNEVKMSELTEDVEAGHTTTVHLVCRDADRAADWYVRALGAEERHRLQLPDGRFMQIELRFGDSTVMIADEFPEMGVVSPADRRRRFQHTPPPDPPCRSPVGTRPAGRRRCLPAAAGHVLGRPSRRDHRPVRPQMGARRTPPRRPRERTSTRSRSHVRRLLTSRPLARARPAARRQ